MKMEPRPISWFPPFTTLACILFLTACPNPFLKVVAAIAPPTISPGGGVFGTDQSVSLSTSLSGAAIYYTTDGSTPTAGSAKYSGPIVVSGNGRNEVIKAINVAGSGSSAVVEASFTINYSIGGASTLAAPTFSVSSGVYTAAPAVTLSYPSGSSAYYTTNGTTPSASSGTLYNPLTRVVGIATANGAQTTVRVISVESGYIASPVVSATYEINESQVGTPQLSVAGGTYSADQTTITLSVPSAPTGTTIYYTTTSGTSGTTPTTSSNNFPASSPTPLTVIGDGTVETIEAMATAPGYGQSTVAAAIYTISYPAAAAPSFSPGSATYSSDQSVSLSDTTTGAAIYYTTDSSPPTYPVSGTTQTYTGTAISVAGNGTTETIQAIARSSTTKVSTIAAATYAITYSPVPTPVFSLSSGEYATAQTGITLTVPSAPSGTTIYYTTSSGYSGTTPTTSSSVYSSSLSTTGTGTVETIEAMATAPGYSQSTTAIAIYAIAPITFAFSGSGGFAIPNGVTQITVKLWGGGGGGGWAGLGVIAPGGGGGFAEQTLSVSPGQVLNVTVGAGGGAPSSCAVGGGAFGGGMSAVSLGGFYYAIAGGGGGGGAMGSGSGGAGGGAGTAGGNNPYGLNGGGPGTDGIGNGGVSGGIGGGGGSGSAANGVGANGGPLSGGTGGQFTLVFMGGGSGGSGYGGGGGGGTFGSTPPGVGAGGGGGGNYGSIIADGSGSTPGNSTDPDLPSGDAYGAVPGSGSCGAAGAPGYVVIYAN